MKKDTVIQLKKLEVSAEDPLTEVLRQGARKLLMHALEAEVQAFLLAHEQIRDDVGKRQIVRSGYGPQRKILTGIGEITARAPKVADRRKQAPAKVRFASTILPPYLRRTKSIEELLPWLYPKGVSTGDFSEALAALLGKNAPGLSASTISRLKETWSEEMKQWQQRSLKGKEYVYFWVDGVHFGARLEDAFRRRSETAIIRRFSAQRRATFHSRCRRRRSDKIAAANESNQFLAVCSR